MKKTKAEIQHLLECAEHLLSLVPKSKKPDALGAANDLFLFLEGMKREAKDA